MPLEIKYKNPVKQPIKAINFTDRDNDLLEIELGDFHDVIISITATDFQETVAMEKDEFKEWAAAVYKFSQEI